MDNSALFTLDGKTLYKGILLNLMAACLAVMVASCSESNLNTGVDEETAKPLETSTQVEPSVIASGTRHGVMIDRLGDSRKKNHNTSTAEFVSPLFGLATAPNGDILVADAGSGVATLDGNTDIPLPGISDLSPLGRGSAWVLKGLTGNPGDNTGQALYRIAKGKKRLVADLFAFERDYNPDGAELIDSNPFDLEGISGQAAIVADAGANDLLRIDNQGNIHVLAVFPDELVSTDNVKSLIGCSTIPEPDRPPICFLPPQIPAQAVPTSIAIGPDGYYYVGELKGFPAPVGVSNIWRVSPNADGAMCGSSPDCQKVFDGGFTSIIDMAFDGAGNLHVAELDESSWFAVEMGAGVGGTINKCNTSTATCTEVATGIPILTAITFGKKGDLWATQNALIPGLAEVINVQ